MSDGLRTLLVGIDAACDEVLDPLFDEDVLPALGRLFERGTAGPLKSQIPPWTASAWPSLYTGTNPGKHGVFDFLTFDEYDWSVVDATAVRTPPLWVLLDHSGLSSVVVNVPVTHPPSEFDGALVPGYVGPEDPTCHPSGLLDEVRDATGPYRVYPEHTGKSAPDRDDIVREYTDLADMRGRAFRYLADRFDPEFGFLQFQGTDAVVHELGGDREAIGAIYRAVDRELESVLEACSPETVLVASDHGIGPYSGHEVRVNEVLRRAGLVETVRGGRGMPTWAEARDRDLAATEKSDGLAAGIAAGVTRAMARCGLTSQRLASVLEPLGLDEAVARVVPRSAIRAATDQVDFPNSKAYVRSRVECGVRVNLQGRESEGVVPPAEYDEVRRAVVDLLANLETPAGDPVFETVAPREEFFDGNAVEHAVDVVAVPAGFEHMLSAQLRDAVFDEPREPWNHKRHGILAAEGKEIDDTAGVAGAHLLDVAPTVLATLGVPVGEHMDGDPLPVVDCPGVDAYPDARRSTNGTERTETVETRLNDLGYLQ